SIKKRLKDMGSAGKHVSSLPGQGSAALPPVAPKQSPVLKPAEGALDRWLRDLANSAQDSNLGSWLHDSPAFHKGIADLKALVDLDKTPSMWNLSNLPSHLRLADGPFSKTGDSILAALGNVSLPRMPAVTLPSISLASWKLSAPRLPRIG